MSQRTAECERKTGETRIAVRLSLDGSGQAKVASGIPFFDHMLELFAKHSLFDLEVEAEGDLDVDAHHTVEDVGLVLGRAINEGLGEKAGIRRYGFFLLPMDEVLAQAALDCSGRPHLAYGVTLPYEMIGVFETALVKDFFQALVNEAGMNLHLSAEGGNSAHHVVEAVFKAFARALGMAVELDPRVQGVPSTKGTL